MLDDKLYELLVYLQINEEKAIIHCAAGIHRTGTLAYSLLRLDGKNEFDAYELLDVMRHETYIGVG